MIQQNTVYTITFLMVLSSDHITPATGSNLIGSLQISKSGGPFVITTNNPIEIGNGWYSCVLTAAETNTPGDLSFHCAPSIIPNVDPTDFREQIIAVLRLA